MKDVHSRGREPLGEPIWIFGYGSLIARPGFEPVQTRAAVAEGWARRFWQRSHDHRGTVDSPGLVVTLVESRVERCHGLLHRLPDRDRDAVLAALDHRERDGYERVRLAVRCCEGEWHEALSWVARPGNPSWAGEAELSDMAATIDRAVGDSGPNRDYLRELHARLGALGIDDPHVRALAERVAGGID